MEKTLTTATGREVPCNGVITGYQFSGVLFVRIKEFSYVEAATVFSDPAETATLTYEDRDRHEVYTGYTNLMSIEADRMTQKPGELLVKLSQPKPEEEKES